jgi:hypothetical protein
VRQDKTRTEFISQAPLPDQRREIRSIGTQTMQPDHYAADTTGRLYFDHFHFVAPRI